MLGRPNLDLGRYHSSRRVINTLENPINTGIKLPLAADRDIARAVAVNRARIRAPRRVLDAVFGHLPLPLVASPIRYFEPAVRAVMAST